jgi:hypothetical protein
MVNFEAVDAPGCDSLSERIFRASPIMKIGMRVLGNVSPHLFGAV